MKRDDLGYDSSMKHTYVLRFSSETEAQGSCRGIYMEPKRLQMNYDTTLEIAAFIC